MSLLSLPSCSATRSSTASACATPLTFADWHRQLLLECVCQSMGANWLADFTAQRGKLAMYIAVDNKGHFQAIERLYATTDSAQLAKSEFTALYQARISAPDVCWPAPQGAIQNTFDTLRTSNGYSLIRHFSVLLLYSPTKTCSCH